jgi:hypothetical protein
MMAQADGTYAPIDLDDLMWGGPEVLTADARTYLDNREVRDTLNEQAAWDLLAVNEAPSITEITVDLDHHKATTPELTEAKLAQYGTLYSRTSSDGVGRHLRLVLTAPVTPYVALDARKRAGDDPKRVLYDLYRAVAGRPAEAGGWLAEEKYYWPSKGQGAPHVGKAGEWVEVTP